MHGLAKTMLKCYNDFEMHEIEDSAKLIHEHVNISV